MMVKKAHQAEEVLKFASMWNMDGLVMIGFCHQDYRYLREHMRIPFVVYDGLGETPERIVNITIDDFDGGRQLGVLLHKNGHRRALCLSDNLTGIDLARIQGFCEGFGDGETEILRIPMRRVERLAFYRQNLARLRSVTAVFAVSDCYAIELLRFLAENGLRVPEDISLVGFDDIPLCQLVSPALTTIRQDGALRARLALEKLRALREGETVENTITLPVTLIERESTRRISAEL